MWETIIERGHLTAEDPTEVSPKKRLWLVYESRVSTITTAQLSELIMYSYGCFIGCRYFALRHWTDKWKLGGWRTVRPEGLVFPPPSFLTVENGTTSLSAWDFSRTPQEVTHTVVDIFKLFELMNLRYGNTSELVLFALQQDILVIGKNVFVLVHKLILKIHRKLVVASPPARHL